MKTSFFVIIIIGLAIIRIEVVSAKQFDVYNHIMRLGWIDLYKQPRLFRHESFEKNEKSEEFYDVTSKQNYLEAKWNDSKLYLSGNRKFDRYLIAEAEKISHPISFIENINSDSQSASLNYVCIYLSKCHRMKGQLSTDFFMTLSRGFRSDGPPKFCFGIACKQAFVIYPSFSNQVVDFMASKIKDRPERFFRYFQRVIKVPYNVKTGKDDFVFVVQYMMLEHDKIVRADCQIDFNSSRDDIFFGEELFKSRKMGQFVNQELRSFAFMCSLFSSGYIGLVNL